MGRPSAREKLLDCAEQLFAEHGLEGVSLRAINTEAGLSAAALHYHFGSKSSLLEALLERKMPALMGRRRDLLDEIGRGTNPPTTRDVFSALVQPQVELLRDGGEAGLRYLRLTHRLQVDGDLDPDFVIKRWPGGVDRLVPLLRKANPSLPHSLIELRLTLAIDVILARLASQLPSQLRTLNSDVTELLDFVTGGFEAPISGE